jgi:hypothetical protein
LGAGSRSAPLELSTPPPEDGSAHAIGRGAAVTDGRDQVVDLNNAKAKLETEILGNETRLAAINDRLVKCERENRQ